MVGALTLFSITCCKEVNTKKSMNKIKPANLPEYIRNMENLHVYSIHKPSIDTVVFEKEGSFGSNENVFIEGHIFKVAVDTHNRVYIEGFLPGQVTIYVFRSDGTYLTSLGGYGKGPGEFLIISDMAIQNNNLVVFDRLQQKISFFSLNDFTLKSEAILNQKLIKDNELLGLQYVKNLFLLNEKKILMGFRSNFNSNKNRQILYYNVLWNGKVQPGIILEQQRYKVYETDMQRNNKGYIITPFRLPVNRSSLIAVSANGTIYSAWSENFLIKIFNTHGEYQRAFYYSLQNKPFSLSKLELGSTKSQILANASVPKTWPVLHTMFLDDRNRLWVFTIAKSDSTYMGWILNKRGELLAKFKWPGKRYRRIPGLKPLMMVKNGYFYTLERNLDKGIERIVKWKIKFNEQQ